MERKTSLLIMAAGIGSRFGGGIKQLEPVGLHDEIIMDYSIHDALEAGFNKIILVIRKDIEADFRERIGNRLEKICGRLGVELAYAFQDMNDVPGEVPAGRRKPWGTGQAVLSAKELIQEPFAVINADDYYGVHAFQEIYNYLTENEDDEKYHYAMVGYILSNTLTENGYVSRGICEMDKDAFLTGITERTHIEQRDMGVQFTEDDGQTWEDIAADSIVSMNMFGFTASMLKELECRFPEFLKKGLEENPMKCEYFLPSVVSDLIEEDKADVKVLRSEDRWYGITYKEDKEAVVSAVQKLKDTGVYPQHLWEA